MFQSLSVVALVPILVWVALMPANAGEAALQDLYGDPLPPGAIARMGTIRFHQGDQVQCLAYSPNGKLIAAGNFGLTREVVLWDAATGRKHATIAWEGSPARSVAFSPDGKNLAAGDMDGLIRIWDVNSGRAIATLRGNHGSISSVAYSPDGARLLSGSQGRSPHADPVPGQKTGPENRGTICLWDIANGKIVLELAAHAGAVNAVAYAPDGKTIGSCSDDKTARLWDAITGQELIKFEEQNPLFSIAFSQDGTAVAYGTMESICLRNSRSGQEVWRKPGSPFRLISLAFSPDSKTLALCGHFPPVEIWDAKTGAQIQQLPGNRDRVYGVAFSPDGQTLAACSDDGSVRLWKTRRGEPILFGEGHDTTIVSIAYSPDGKTLVSGGGRDRTLRLWDAFSGKQLVKMEGHEHEVSCVAFSPDGKLLASGSPDRTIRIWDAASGKQLRQIVGINSNIGPLVFSPDGSMVAMAGGYRIGLWDVATGEEIRSLTGHTSYVFAVAFSPDGKTLVSGGQDNTIRLWDVASGTTLRQIPAGKTVFSLALAPDGKQIAAGVFVHIRIYEAETGNEVLHSEDRYHSGVGSVVYAPDGQTVATAFGVVDVHTGKTLLPLKENGGRIFRLAFSPDGRNLATSLTDSTVLVWDLATLKKLASEAK